VFYRKIKLTVIAVVLKTDQDIAFPYRKEVQHAESFMFPSSLLELIDRNL
jgi:hypothetical protein